MHIRRFRLMARAVISLAAVLVAAPWVSAAGPLRILPLGDSITNGYNKGEFQGPGTGSYRTQLWKRLGSDPTRFDFLGSQNNGPADLGDKDNEGHNGYSINDIIRNIDGVAPSDDPSANPLDNNGGYWLTGGGIRPAIYPDVVLLHIGTNNMGGGSAGATAAAGQLDTLVGHIFALRPTTKVIVAGLIPRADSNSAAEAVTHQYNALIPGIVTKYKNLGDACFFVDMHPLLNPATDYKPDGIHPLPGGYDKMGDAWYGAMVQAGIVTPEPCSLVMLSTAAAVLATFAWRRRTRTE
jgi:lysophospholipase L1-like esterase